MAKLGMLISFGIVIFILSNTDARRRIDCTKFVFAPVCRGIAAKRDSLSGSETYQPSYRDILSQAIEDIGGLSSEEEHSQFSIISTNTDLPLDSSETFEDFLKALNDEYEMNKPEQLPDQDTTQEFNRIWEMIEELKGEDETYMPPLNCNSDGPAGDECMDCHVQTILSNKKHLHQ